MNRTGLKLAAKQCIAEAKGPVKKVSLIYLISLVVIMGIDIASTLLSEGGNGGSHISDSLSSAVGIYVVVYGFSLILQCIMWLVEAGYTVFSLKLSRNEDFDCKVLLSGAQDWLRVICFYVIRAIYLSLWSFVYAIPLGLLVSPLALAFANGDISQTVFIGIVALLSIILSLIISLRYWGGFFVLMDHPEMRASEALGYTKELCRHQRWDLFKLELSFLPTILLCVITVGVMLIWKLPYIMATYAHAYHHMVICYKQRINYHDQQFYSHE